MNPAGKLNRRNMKKGILCLLGATALSTAVFATPVGYQFDITTTYQFGVCGVANCASPDTGQLTVVNNGASTFVGTISLTPDGGPGSFAGETFTGSFAPGATLNFVSGPEGSNQGGFGPLGVLFSMVGNVNLGANTEAVGLSVHDADIHSGFVRTSPCDGVATDAFVLQGGSPNGCDNGDGFETTQAPGHFEFLERGSKAAVPEPISTSLVGGGLVALAFFRRRPAR